MLNGFQSPFIFIRDLPSESLWTWSFPLIAWPAQGLGKYIKLFLRLHQNWHLGFHIEYLGAAFNNMSSVIYPPMLNKEEPAVTLQHFLLPNWLQHWNGPLCTAPQLAQGAPSHDVEHKTFSEKHYQVLLVQARAVWRSLPNSCSTVGCLCTCSGVSVE